MSDAKENAEFQFPPCWNDDMRMSVLFAPPRSENLNPQDWAGKYKFWSELVIEWGTKNQKLVIELEDLKTAFRRKGKVPSSLERVFQEMNKKGDLVPADQYFSQGNQSSWTSWGLGLVKSSLTWSWNKVKASLIEIEKELPRCVLPNVLKKLCDDIMQLPVAASGETIEMEELFELYPDVFSKAYENEILLNHLEKLGRIALDASGSQVVVKFMPLEKKNSTQHNTSLWNMSLTTSPRASKEKSTEITEVDRSLATIKRTEKLLNDEVENLQKEMDALEQKARSCLRDGSRPAAKAALYRRKQLQSVFDKRNQALLNIHTMKLQLSQAKTDTKILEAYQIGLSALKNSFGGDLSLNEDKIQDTLIELEGVLEQHRDMANILSNTITVDENESDLEEELKNILAKDDSPDLDQDIDLPSVPDDSPKSVRVAKKQILLDAN